MDSTIIYLPQYSAYSNLHIWARVRLLSGMQGTLIIHSNHHTNYGLKYKGGALQYDAVLVAGELVQVLCVTGAKRDHV